MILFTVPNEQYIYFSQYNVIDLYFQRIAINNDALNATGVQNHFILK
jgi:hypothetical protein